MTDPYRDRMRRKAEDEIDRSERIVVFDRSVSEDAVSLNALLSISAALRALYYQREARE